MKNGKKDSIKMKGRQKNESKVVFQNNNKKKNKDKS